jgi:DNA-binding GntR family transcriptional regulator
MGGYFSIEAVFKRARGWTRDLILGLDGEVAREVITADDRKVQEAHGSDVDIDALARILKMSPSAVRDSIAKLTRNGMVK